MKKTSRSAQLASWLRTKNTQFYRKIDRQMTARRKLLALSLVGILLVGLLAARFLFPTPAPEAATPEITPLAVETVIYGQADISEQAIGVVKNLNTITLVAQSAGPVAAVEHREGSTVSPGQVILSQESAYRAGNAATVQRQIAAQNLSLAEETLKNTVEVVAQTREQADLVEKNGDELRQLSEKSIDETEKLVSLLETQVDELETALDATTDTDTQNALRGSLISVQANLNATRAQLRAIAYDVDEDNPPAQLEDSAKELVFTSTELQLKAAQIQKDIAWLSLKAARIAEAATRVSAPFGGIIEKIYVEPGQYVTPGTPVAVLRGEARLCLQISVAGKVASRIQDTQQLTVDLAGNRYSLPITHVSATAVNGNMYEVLAIVPADLAPTLYEGQSAAVQLPLYALSQQGGNAYLPIDAVFVTNRNRFVFVYQDGKAVKTQIETGEIIGDKIEVTAGLAHGQTVITDRRVIDQQAVTPLDQPTVIELGMAQ